MARTRPLSPLLWLLALLAGVLAAAAHPASASAAGIAQTRVGGSDQLSALCTGVSAADIAGGQRGNTATYDGKAVGDLFATDANAADAPTLQPGEPPLSGGRSGEKVKDLVGPPNSIIRGSAGRIYRTDQNGRVITDITAKRAKDVTPGRGFGDHRDLTPEELEWLKQMGCGGA